MSIRIVILAIFASTVAGCSNEGMSGVGASLTTSALTVQTATGYAAAPDTGSSEAVPRKNLASKVLAAIALERVTGRKADPARLTD